MFEATTKLEEGQPNRPNMSEKSRNSLGERECTLIRGSSGKETRRSTILSEQKIGVSLSDYTTNKKGKKSISAEKHSRRGHGSISRLRLCESPYVRAIVDMQGWFKEEDARERKMADPRRE